MKILIIRFSSIGDIVLTSPVVRCLKQQLPSGELHFLTKSHFQQILEANPAISKIYAIEKDVNEVIPALKAEKYDAIIDLHDNIRSRQISAALKAKTYRYNKQRIKRFLLTQFRINLLNNHVVDRYFTAVTPLHVINDGKGLDYFIPEKDNVTMQQMPFTHLAGYCVIVVGAKHFTKQIPMVKLEELCRKIKIPILLLGGPDDVYMGLQLENMDPFKISSACGRYNINQSAAVIKRAKYVITPDTGMMHIAAAFNKRIVSIWGGTEKRLGFTPYLMNNTTSIIIENNQLSCRPCHKHGLDRCPKGHFKCMMDLDMQKVIDVL
ncbi:MAG: glycosyltransferase family 9 protein [Sphingobacteriales bacterium]|jgi:ADP-heptose:LPS heptosyltransferase|nr:glycosyltransferase family 9 protein [Sphingobacteriales bacterium]